MDWNKLKELYLQFTKTKKEEFFEEFIKSSSSWFLSLAYNILRNEADSKDAFQLFCEKLWRITFSPNFEFPSNFKAWLTRIAVNEAINLYRKNKRQFKNEAKLIQQKASTFKNYHQGNPVQGKLTEEEKRTKIEEAINSLDEDKRSAFVLVVMEGLSYSEAAEILGVSPSQIRGRVYQARKLLREKLKNIIAEID